MLKIYIQNIPIDDLRHKSLDLDKYLVKENEITKMYSNTGIYIIQNNNTFMIQPSFEDSYKQMTYKYKKNEYNLLLEYYNDNTIKILSQLPCEYILDKTIKLEYKLSKKSPLSLILYGNYEINVSTNTKDSIFKKDKYYLLQPYITHFVIMDFYFECLETDFQLENPFFTEEFNMFLSLLN